MKEQQKKKKSCGKKDEERVDLMSTTRWGTKWGELNGKRGRG